MKIKYKNHLDFKNLSGKLIKFNSGTRKEKNKVKKELKSYYKTLGRHVYLQPDHVVSGSYGELLLLHAPTLQHK